MATACLSHPALCCDFINFIDCQLVPGLPGEAAYKVRNRALLPGCSYDSPAFRQFINLDFLTGTYAQMF